MGSDCAVWTHPLCGCPSHSSWASHLMPPHLSQSLTACANSLPFRHPLVCHAGCQLSLSGSPSVCPRPITLAEATVALFPLTLAGEDAWSRLSRSLSDCLTLHLKPVLARFSCLRRRQPLCPSPAHSHAASRTFPLLFKSTFSFRKRVTEPFHTSLCGIFPSCFLMLTGKQSYWDGGLVMGGWGTIS